MKDVHYTIDISADKEKVWNTMLGEETYKQWTGDFMPGSYFEGTWEEGTDMDFLAPDPDGSASGMRAHIVKNVPSEFISMQHYAEIKGAEVTPFNNDVVSLENYSFEERDGMTQVTVDLLNLPDDWVSMMDESWPKALKKLKEVTEG